MNMPFRLDILIELLHAPGEIALATNSAADPGYPFATLVPFATDEHHRPLLLISHLAVHTQNLIADPRASLSVARPLGGGEIARVSLIGNLLPIEPPPLLIARYQRFHPEAERWLQLGDFRFFRHDSLRIRVVGGFAQASWLDGKRLLDAPHIPLADESRLIERAQSFLADDIRLLGVDAYGADFVAGETRRRIAFTPGPLSAEATAAALERSFRDK